MIFSFIKKFEKKSETIPLIGDIVEFIRGENLGEVCLVTYGRVISLQDPHNTWINLTPIWGDIRKVPKGSVVTLTQE
jgi:hypothetical protein